MRGMRQRIGFAIVGVLLLTAFACKHKYTPEIPDANYPADVNHIVLTKCATSGCHNRTGYQNAGGLNLDSWDHLFNGGKDGAVVVPYRPENSTLLYYINNGHFPEFQWQHPSIPAENVITEAEYTTIKSWIAQGAPDKDGNIPFASNAALRQKIYLVHGGQGSCKLLAVIDGERKVVMRYLPIGTSEYNESAHNIRVSQDGKYAYVCFLGSQYIQKINAQSDQIIDSVNVGNKQWGVINLSEDGKKLIVNAWQSNGEVLIINTETMTIEKQFSGSNLFINPHGILSNSSFDTFYVSSLYGNSVYKFSIDFKMYKEISLDGNPVTHTAVPGVTPDPHDLAYNPDRTRFFVTCQGTNELRVFDARRDTLMRVIPVGMMPQHIAISRSSNYAIVACMDDDNTNGNGYKGSVYVINYKTLDVVKKIEGQFSEPHCVLVDDIHQVFYVLNKNLSSSFAGAHTSICGKPDGWYSVYDLKTLEPLAERIETVSNPYFADTRFK